MIPFAAALQAFLILVQQSHLRILMNFCITSSFTKYLKERNEKDLKKDQLQMTSMDQVLSCDVFFFFLRCKS